MNAITHCPDLDDLKRFAAGNLSDEEAGPLEEHVLSCPECVARMPAVDIHDTFVDALRATPFTSGSTTATLDTGPGQHDRQTITARNDGIDSATRFDFLAPAESPDELGRLGGYRVLRVIGAGGMGGVFEAEDLRLKRHVALKVMKPELAANAESSQRFLREAQAMAALDHDHVVTVHQVGEECGVPFLAMQLLRGETLDTLLKKVAPTLLGGELPVAQGGGLSSSSPSPGTTVPLDEVLRIGRELADGLSAAHERGLIHRDIKPGNIWLETSRGRPRVKILDFGLAHVADADMNLTQSAVILGTPSYMAPEQARGGAVDPRADLFSLGCVLYRVTTGEPAFKGANPLSVLMALATTTPAAPRELNPAVPTELNDLIVSLLSKDPSARPASAREVMERLDAVGWTLRTAEQAPSLAPDETPQAPGAVAVENALCGVPYVEDGVPSGALEEHGLRTLSREERDGLGTPSSVESSSAAMGNAQPAKPPRRRRLVGIATAGAAAAALVLGIVIVIKDHKGNVVATVETNDAADVKASPEYTVHVAPSGQAEQKAEGNRQTAETQIAGAGKTTSGAAAGPHSGRLPEASGAPEAAAEAPKPKIEDLSPKTSPASPKSAPAAPGENLKSLGPMALVTEPTAIEGVKSWTVETIAPRGRIYQAKFNPAGTLAATLGIDATLRLWHPATGKLVKPLVGCNAGQHAFAWSPDGKRIAVAESSRVLVWETETGKRLTAFAIDFANHIFNVAFSPDGRTLAIAMLRGLAGSPDTVELYAVEGGELLDSHRTFCGWDPWNDGTRVIAHELLAWSPDGERLTIGNEIWDTAANASRDAGAGVAIAWRDDGVLVKAVPAGQGDQAALELWRVDTNERLHTLNGDKQAVRFRAFSPGGKFLLATSARLDNRDEDARAYMFNTTTGEVAHRVDLPGDGEGYTQYALSPDGATVLAFGPELGNVWSIASAAEDGPPGPSRKATDGLGRPSPEKPLWKWPALVNSVTTFLSAWSPDGKSLALRGGGDALSLWELASGWPRVTRYAPGQALDWNNDDGLIRAWQEDGCAIYDPATGQQHGANQFVSSAGRPFPSRDGSRVAAVREKDVTIYATDTGQALRTLPTESKYAPTWSLDRGRLITVGEKTTLWDLDSGDALKTIDPSAPADWSPDGKRLAFVYEHGKRLEIRDVESGEQALELENDPPLIVPKARLSWSRDGTRLAGLGRVWDAATGKALHLLPRFPPSWLARFTLSSDDYLKFDYRALWSPDGDYLVYLAADHSVAVVEAASGRVAATLLSFTQDRSLSVSPHGHFHCSPRFDGELVYIVETDAGQEALSPPEFAEKYGWKNDRTKVAPTLRGGEAVAKGDLLALPSRSAGSTTTDAPGENPKSLGPLTLVQRPAALPGVESWSLEPALPAGVLYRNEQAPALSPDGKLLAVGGEDGHVRIYDAFHANTPRLIRLLVGHASYVVALDFSPDGKWIASAERDQPNVRVWETASGSLVSSTFIGLKLQSHVVPLRWSPDGSTLAIGSDNNVGGGAVLLDPASGEVIRSLAAPGFKWANSFSWSPDGAKLAASSWNSVFVFNANTGDVERHEMRHPGAEGYSASHSLAWSPDGESIAFSMGGHDTLIWKVADGALRAKLPVQAAEHERWVLRWMDHGTRLGLNTAGQWEEWDVDQGTRVGTLSTPCLAHSADANVVAAGGDWGGGWMGGFDIIDTRTKKRRTLGLRRSSGRVAWSADGRTLAESGEWPIVWNLDGAPRLECLPQPAGNGTIALTWLPASRSLLEVHPASDTAIWSRGKQGWQPKMLGIAADWPAAVSSDGKRLAYLASGTDGKTVIVYDLNAGGKLRELGPHAARVTALGWSPDAARLVAGTQGGDVTIWNAQNGASLHSARPIAGWYPVVSCSPDGKTVLIECSGNVCLCDDELRVRHHLPGHVAPYSLPGVAWADDGKEVLTVDTYHVRRWDVATGKRLNAVPRPLQARSGGAMTFQFSPDLARIAAPSGVCRIVNAANGDLEAAIVPLDGGKAVVVSADGHYLASAPKAAEQLVYVVQTAAGQELLPPKEFAEKYGWKNDPSKVKLSD